MRRSLSHSEIRTVSDCEAKHAFGYTGRLTQGDALDRKLVSPRLVEGRAWGRAVAALHENQLRVDADVMAGAALVDSLLEDRARQLEHYAFDADAFDATKSRLLAILDHYIATTDPFVIDRPEHEIEVALPSRAPVLRMVDGRVRERRGRGRSNRYRFLAYLDGIHVDDDGRQWLVEYKLRGSLTSVALITLDPQARRYAWAAREALDIDPVGIIVDERLNEMPKSARVVQAKRKGEGIDGMVPSHAKDQLCTAEAYAKLCADFGVGADPDTLEALARRRWQQRVPVMFRPGELDEIGDELVSVAQEVRDLDNGSRRPVRNPSQRLCSGCQFREICPNPDDTELVDALFTRRPPKRLRPQEEESIEMEVDQAVSEPEMAF